MLPGMMPGIFQQYLGFDLTDENDQSDYINSLLDHYINNSVDKMKRLTTILMLIITISLTAQQTGKLAGRITDIETKSPLPNASVIIQDLETGIYANDKGQFFLE